MEIIPSINSLNYSLVISRNYKICTWTDGYQTRDTILAEFLDVLEHPNRTKYITLLNTLTPETISIFDFKVPGWRSNERLLEVNNLFKRLKVAIKEIQKRDYLSITPKVEDIKVVYKWIETFNVPHFYFQVFFDKVFGISFEQILSIISNSDNEGVLLDRKSSQEKVG